MLSHIMQPMGPYLRQYVIVILVNQSVLGAGLGMAWTSPVLVKLSNETSSVFHRPITGSEGSWIVSVGFLGAFAANFVTAYLSDRIGRKYCILLGCLPRILSYLFMVFATEVWMLLVGRVLDGVGTSLTFIVVPMYASEIASKQIRGGLGTLLQIFCSVGIVIMLSMGPYLEYRRLNEIALCITVAVTVPLTFLPDSPYFLFKRGKIDEATKVLTFLRGSADLANEELKEYQAEDVVETISIKELLESKTVLKSLGIIIILSIGVQMTGFNAISFYLQPIFESAKTSVSSDMASVIIGLIQLTASLCTIAVIDRFGRKPILAVTMVGLTIGMLGLGTFFYLEGAGYEVVGFLNYLPLMSLILIVYCFGAGLGSLSWLLMAELFDGRFRALGMLCGLQSSVLVVFLTTRFFEPVTKAIGPAATYWGFSVNCLCLCLFILYCVPETKGKSFAEIQESLDGKRKGDRGVDMDKS